MDINEKPKYYIKFLCANNNVEEKTIEVKSQQLVEAGLLKVIAANDDVYEIYTNSGCGYKIN